MKAAPQKRQLAAKIKRQGGPSHRLLPALDRHHASERDLDLQHL